MSVLTYTCTYCGDIESEAMTVTNGENLCTYCVTYCGDCLYPVKDGCTCQSK